MIEELKGMAEAENLLVELGIEALPIRPIAVANRISDPSFTVVIEVRPFDSAKILGRAIGNDRGAVVRVNSTIPDEGRLNFTAAHEIGHVCMHIMPGFEQSFECGLNELYSPHTDPREKEANGFASGLLMPSRLISPLWRRETTWASIQRISKACETSLEASFRRLQVLDKSPTALVIHKDRQFKRFVASENFGFFLNRDPLSRAQMSECTNVLEEEYPADFDEVDAGDWVNSVCRGSKLNKIYSSTILLKDGYTYSLLTYDDECLLDDGDE